MLDSLALHTHMRAYKPAHLLKALFCALVAVLCLSSLVSTQALAQEVIPDFYKDPGIDPNRDYVNQHQSEHIDPFTGALQIQSTDIHLPSNGGFELNVIRSYNSASVDPTAQAQYSSSLGLGWQLHFGRVLTKTGGNFTTYCQVNNTGSTVANPVLELPDGSRQVLYNGMNSSTATLITKQRWKADCVPTLIGSTTVQTFVVYSPDGVRYDMNQVVVDNQIPNVAVLYTTKITDRNGNTASIKYVGSTSVISTVSTAEAILDFTYESLQSWETHPRISTISVRNAANYIPGGITWHYYYTPTDPAGTLYENSYQLTKVTRPDGSSWQYSYIPKPTSAYDTTAGWYLMHTMTYPQGGVVTYVYQMHIFDSLHANLTPPPPQIPVVYTKTTSDGTWSFNYIAPTAYHQPDQTVVTLPNGIGTITYKHIGVNYTDTAQDPVWGIGLLLEKDVGSLQTETYTWDKQQVSSQLDLRPGTYQTVLQDHATYAPALTGKTITRDGTNYTTTYPIANYDSYGNPQTIIEAGPNGGNRTTNLTYYINTNKWIVKQKANETISGISSIIRNFDSSNGNLQSITQNGVTTSYYRFSSGDINAITDPRSKVTTFTYYKCGIPQNETHPVDAANNKFIYISRVVDGTCNVSSETDGEGHTYGYTYDGLNRLRAVTYPKSGSSSVGITFNANDTTKTATRGGLSEVTNYDGYGRALSVNLGGNTTTYQYDPLGRMTFQSNPNNSTVGTHFSYDILGRITKITNADTSFKKIDFLSNAQVRITDERSNVTTNTYRAYGDPDKKYVMSIAPPVSSMGVTIGRNGVDQIESVQQNGLTRTYWHDPQQGYYLKTVTQPEIGTITYVRDNAGNMTSKTIGTLKTTYGYDDINRQIAISYPGNTPAVTKTYSGTNKLKSVSSSVGTRTYQYDADDNLQAETLSMADGSTFNAIYGYDGIDHLSSITYPTSGLTLNYAPDVLGRPTQAATSSTTYVSNVTYWPSGQVNQITYGNGTTSTYAQDASRLWPTSFATAKGGSTYINNSYGYYATGDLSSISDSSDSNYNRTLDYDGAGQLKIVNGPWGSGSIGYDGNGNISSQTFGTAQLTYTPDANGRLQSVAGSGGYTRNTTFGYDIYGNVVAADGNSFLYDDAPNLVSFNAGKPNEIDYQYDGSNMRVLTNKAGVKTYEFYAANGNLLQEFTPSKNNSLLEYIYLGNKRIAQRAKDDTVPGSVTLTASSGAVLLGQSIMVTAVVTGSPTPTGTVTFYDNGAAIGGGPVQLVNGQAQLTVTLATPGTHSITASYGGDANIPSGTSNVLAEAVQVNSSTSISGSPNPSIFGHSVTLTATIAGSGNASGTVTFNNNGSFLGSASVIGNTAALTMNNLAIGYYTITANYSGDGTNLPSTTSTPYYLVVNDLTQATTSVINPPTIVGVNHLVRAFQVQVQGSQPTGQVTISEGTTVLATAPLAYDSASGNYYALINTLKLTTLGQHTLTAQYGGDSNNKPGSVNFVINVVPVDPSVLSAILQLILD